MPNFSASFFATLLITRRVNQASGSEAYLLATSHQAPWHFSSSYGTPRAASSTATIASASTLRPKCSTVSITSSAFFRFPR